MFSVFSGTGRVVQLAPGFIDATLKKDTVKVEAEGMGLEPDCPKDLRFTSALEEI